MLHKFIPLADRHPPHSYEFADAATRTSAGGFAVADLHKLALQLDDGTLWRLSSITPTWAAFGATGPAGADGAQGPAGADGAQGPAGADGAQGIQGLQGPAGGGGGGGGLDTYPYASRASLRALAPTQGDTCIVDGLGLFTWEAASTEPDDDESCFVTASGCWLLQAPSWDLVDAWQSVDDAARDDDDEDEFLRLAAKMLTGSATCAVTSIAAVTSISFSGEVTGAVVGDGAIATPPNQLGSDAINTARLSHHAYVSATDTVTVVLCNASAATATTNAAVQVAWPINVIKN